MKIAFDKDGFQVLAKLAPSEDRNYTILWAPRDIANKKIVEAEATVMENEIEVVSIEIVDTGPASPPQQATRMRISAEDATIGRALVEVTVKLNSGERVTQTFHIPVARK